MHGGLAHLVSGKRDGCCYAAGQEAQNNGQQSIVRAFDQGLTAGESRAKASTTVRIRNVMTRRDPSAFSAVTT